MTHSRTTLTGVLAIVTVVYVPLPAMPFVLMLVLATLTALFTRERTKRTPLDFLRDDLPLLPALQVATPKDVYPNGYQQRMVADYAAGILTAEGFGDFMRVAPRFINRFGSLAWAENPKRYVQHLEGVPRDEWPCGEIDHGHLLDKHAWRMQEYAEDAKNLYKCLACGLDFSEQGMYGSVLFDTEKEIA